MQNDFKLMELGDIQIEAFDENTAFYIDRLLSEKGKVIGNSEKGIILLSHYCHGLTVLYVYVVERFRHKGVAFSLFDAAVEYCSRMNTDFNLKILFNTPFADAIEYYAQRRTMKMTALQSINIMMREDLETSDGIAWYDGRLSCIANRLLHRNYHFADYAHTPENIMLGFCDTFAETDLARRVVPVDMHPLNHPNLDKTLSFMAWKDDSNPVAYLAAERYGDSVVVKEHFCLKSYTGFGVSILPLYAFAHAVAADQSIKRISFLVLDSNEEASRMRMRYYKPFIRKSIVQKIYSLSANEQKILKQAN